MKNISKSLKFFLVIIIILLIVVFGYFYKKSQNNKYDFSKTEEYSNKLMGISLIYPSQLKPGTLSFHSSPDDQVVFYEKDMSKYVFQISLMGPKFDPRNVTVPTWNKLEEVPLISLKSKMSYAMPSPTMVKVENVQSIQIGDNKYYTYAFGDNTYRTDTFILTKENSYLEFVFRNQEESFIKNILSSVKKY